MDAVRKKRSEDGQAQTRRMELEQQLAALRDQEAVLLRQIELLKARSAGPAQKAPKLDQLVPTPPKRLQVEPKDYDEKLAQVKADQEQRITAYWRELRKTVSAVANSKSTKTWFDTPVLESTYATPSFIEQYTAVIKHPMDFRTIMGKLGKDDSQRQYKHPDEVANDVRLIVSNCELYNGSASTVPVASAARTLQKTWESKWQSDPDGLKPRWEAEMLRQQAEKEELRDLEKAAKGSLPDKIQYFDNSVRRRIEELRTVKPFGDSVFSWEQKRKLSISLSCLPAEHLSGVIEVIAAHQQLAEDSNGELLLDLDALSDPVLHKIQVYVDSVENSKGKDKAKPGTQHSGDGSALRADVKAGVNAEPPTAAAPGSAAPGTAAATVENGHASVQPTSDRAGNADDKSAKSKSNADQTEPSVTAKDGSGSDSGSSSSSSSSSSGSSDSDDSNSNSENTNQGADSNDEAGSKEKVESTMPDADKRWTQTQSLEGGDVSALVSRTDAGKKQPEILRNADPKKSIEVENANDWALEVLEEAEGAGKNAAAPEPAPADPLWNDFARKEAELDRERKAKAEEEEKRKAEQVQEEAEASQKRKAVELQGADEEKERLEREQKRLRELNEINRIGADEESEMADDDLAFGE